MRRTDREAIALGLVGGLRLERGGWTLTGCGVIILRQRRCLQGFDQFGMQWSGLRITS